MNNETIISKLREYQIGEIEKGISMNDVLNFENEFIKLVRIDASNKWLGTPHRSDMSKQWGIIIKIKKPFTNLEGYKQLTKFFNIDITPVVRGVNKGCYGIRLYDMKKNPSIDIVNKLLNYIFNC